jgi:hypothetical protein
VRDDMEKRKYGRFDTKLYVKIVSKSKTAWGLMSDVSENGMYIQSNRDFAMGEEIDIEIFMPDRSTAILKGILRRKAELPDSFRRYGLGIEITEKDIFYRRFMKFFDLQNRNFCESNQTEKVLK